MPFIEYVRKNFKAETLAVIDSANEIIDEYQAQGFILTLRQLYYQFVARALIPNTQKSYSRLGSIVNDARMAGLIDWDSIEDRTRNLQDLSHWDSPQSLVEACADQFRFDLWEDQEVRPEVWIEKEALVGVIAGVCEELDVPYFACRGYVSQSEQWRAAQRFKVREEKLGQFTTILHFGDHDPSGIDMTRDNLERLHLFECQVAVKRLALNYDQIEEYGPPPNPAKMTDSRFERYARRYGDESWELDALEPSVIVDLVRTEVEDLMDKKKFKAAKKRQKDARGTLKKVSSDWDRVTGGF